MASLTLPRPQLEKIRRLLCRLQDHIQHTLITAREREARKFARVVAETSADTIYHVDRISEAAIAEWFANDWPKAWPVQVVMEGVEDDEPLTFPRGTPVTRTAFKCILDPIDGTRNLMVDKRSAWILAALAPQRGGRTRLGDIVVAAMTEVPPSKQWQADQFSVVRGAGRQGLIAERVELQSGTRRRITVRPSTARDCRGGFASISKFFPEGKALLARVEEALWDELYGLGRQASPLVFDDQYSSTGGQIYELLVGHDRMLADLRPLAFQKLGLSSPLVCHPYDICPALLLTEAGGIIEAPNGEPLRVPLNTTSPVAWVGYSNPVLARHVRPVLQRTIRQLLR